MLAVSSYTHWGIEMSKIAKFVRKAAIAGGAAAW